MTARRLAIVTRPEPRKPNHALQVWALLHGLGRRGRTMKMEKHTDEKHYGGR